MTWGREAESLLFTATQNTKGNQNQNQDGGFPSLPFTIVQAVT